VDDAVVGGVMGAISREEMPDFIQAATLNVIPGQIIDPFEIDDLYYLLKVEEVLSATLAGELK
jgi:parvulin-like peptidyl-prolyl isomerase